jgi:hypothetical protein
MSTELIGLVISLIGAIVFITAGVGIPALAVVCIKYLKLKEREQMLEMEYRRDAQQGDLRIDERLRRIEEILNLPAHADVFEGPATSDVQRTEAAEFSQGRVR